MRGAVRSPGSGPPWAWRLAVAAVLGVLRGVFGWRLRVRPPEIIPPPDRPLVVVFNHTSNVDAFLIAYTVWRGLQHWVQPLVKTELFDTPVIGELARRAGAIPVARTEGSGRETAYGDAVARLRAGGTVLIAPEGTTTHDGSLLPLRHGAARLALEAGADVLVVTHFGAQRGFSPVVTVPDRGAIVTITMDVLTARSDEDASALTGRIAATMMDRSEELKATYPQPDAQAAWWPPYSSPASPTATARDNLERYRQSMTEAVAHARERMAQIAEEHELEQRAAQARERAADARERARSTAEDLAARSRARAESLGEQARERVEELASHARETASHLADRLPGQERELDTDGIEVAAPDQTAPDQTAPDQTAPDQTTPDQAEPDPDDTSPDDRHTDGRHDAS